MIQAKFFDIGYFVTTLCWLSPAASYLFGTATVFW